MFDLSSPGSDTSGVVHINMLNSLVNQDVHPRELPFSSNISNIFSVAALTTAMFFDVQSSLYNVTVSSSYLGRLSNLSMYVLYA